MLMTSHSPSLTLALDPVGSLALAVAQS